MKTSTKLFIGAGIALFSPFLTWRISDWYFTQISRLFDELHWGDLAKAASVGILFISIAITLSAAFIEKLEGR